MPDKAFSELSKKQQKARARIAREKAEGVLSTSRNTKERAGAEKAKKAAGRVEKRLSGPSSADLTKPGKPKGLKGGDGLWDILKAALGMAKQGKKNLEDIEKRSRGEK